MMGILDHIDFIIAPLVAFTQSSSRAFVLYFVSYFLICYILYKRRRSHKRFVDFLFPDDIYATGQFLKDILYFVLITAFSALFYSVLNRVITNNPAASTLLNSLLWIVVFDFIMFFTHYLQHKIPLLWKFHALHHEPDKLHFLIAFKHHPVDIILVGVALAVASLLVPPTKINLFLMLFYFAGYHLRHSHIPLEYPKWLNTILVSPSDHQRHHSKRPEHYDQHLGFIFSFWERLFFKQTI